MSDRIELTIENQLAHYDALKAGIFDVVGANLNSRLEGELQQRQLIIAALVIVLLVVVYLYVGFFMSVRTAINRFSTAARSVAEGDMTTHIQLDNRDELGELTTEKQHDGPDCRIDPLSEQHYIGRRSAGHSCQRYRGCEQ